jgi:putative nucleotidyltransferase with HDIG domain
MGGERLDPGIESFARLLGLRDGYTARHAERAAVLALAVGERLQLPADLIDVLGRASRLQDLGKIGVPDAILRKAEPLTPEEWEVMRCHPVWGAEALATMEGFEETATAVRFHHERWDGRGYPDGLAQRAIPWVSRIIGACEAFCSMTADRPYRPALSLARARDLMRAGAGTHFDPDVVDALLAVVEREPELARDDTSPGDGAFGGAFTTMPGAAGVFGGPEPAGGAERPGPAASASGSGAAAGAADGTSPTGRTRTGPPPSRLPAAVAGLRLPALTESRERLVRMLDADPPKWGRMADLVETDPGLAAALLTVARRTASVPKALEALGVERVREICDATPTFDFFQQVTGVRLPPERFRLHAVATQRAARRLATALEHPATDEIAVAALLHDVGRLVLADAHDAYPREVLQGTRTPEERVRAERRVLGYDHATAGGAVLERWGLPERVVGWVTGHHDAGVGPEAAIVRLADMLAHYGAGAPVDPRALLQAAGELSLSPTDLRAAMFDLNAPSTGRSERAEPSPLTDRERDALRGLASGKALQDIADARGSSVSTVRTHLHNAYKKVGAADRAQAVLIATEKGWI